ncbi:hypothetical protein G9A89_000713 [Geosiphon pyriformis]|nr:hypothetical protein G9A89_000713 [Geosiphon pyriformis]
MGPLQIQRVTVPFSTLGLLTKDLTGYRVPSPDPSPIPTVVPFTTPVAPCALYYPFQTTPHTKQHTLDIPICRLVLSRVYGLGVVYTIKGSVYFCIQDQFRYNGFATIVGGGLYTEVYKSPTGGL